MCLAACTSTLSYFNLGYGGIQNYASKLHLYDALSNLWYRTAHQLDFTSSVPSNLFLSF